MPSRAPWLARCLCVLFALFLAMPQAPVLRGAAEVGAEELNDSAVWASMEPRRGGRHKSPSLARLYKSVCHTHSPAPSSSHLTCKSWADFPRGGDALIVPLRC